MNLFILRSTPEPDRLVALAARRCYSSLSAECIDEKMSDAEVERLIAFLRKRNHLSPFEHAEFTFSVDGVSRALSHQLVRHRIASYSQESQRYVNYLKTPKPPFVVPDSVKKSESAFKIYQKALGATLETYKRLVDSGIPPEDARYIFPNAVETKLVFTINARSLFNFFEQRCCVRAQWEIRRLAMKMLKAVRMKAPLLFQNAGAPCQYPSNPFCRENDLDCKLYNLINSKGECDEKP